MHYFMNLPKGELIVHRSKKFNVLANKAGTLYELFKLIFYKNSKNQFAILITFPYLKQGNGILSKLRFPAGKKYIKRLSLVPSGSLTTHLVKYSHWQDGNVHFSQDRKIVTTFKNTSFPLNGDPGHLFSIQLQGLEGFTTRNTAVKRNSQKEIDLDATINKDLEALKFTGWWFNSKKINQNMKKGGPIVQIKMDDSTYKVGFAIAPYPFDILPDHFLFLSVEKIPLLTKTQKSILSFIGGFDPHNDISKDLNFLALIYPASNFKRLINKIPLIDYRI